MTVSLAPELENFREKIELGEYESDGLFCAD